LDNTTEGVGFVKIQPLLFFIFSVLDDVFYFSKSKIRLCKLTKACLTSGEAFAGLQNLAGIQGELLQVYKSLPDYRGSLCRFTKPCQDSGRAFVCKHWLA